MIRIGVFGNRQDDGKDKKIMADGGFDPVNAARQVLRATSTGALGSLTGNGGPFVSFVTVATDVDGAPLMFLSTLAVHTRNITANRRVSLLLVAPGGEGGDPLAGARVTLEAEAVRLSRESPDGQRARRRFLARHPESEGYADFADFSFYRLKEITAHLVAGFGRIHRVAGDDLLVPEGQATAFADAEASVIEHMNDDHADAVALYAEKLLGEAAANWRVVASDPDGLDLANDSGTVRRLAFPKRQVEVMDLRLTLKALSEAARATL